jgi:hypothetical protein
VLTAIYSIITFARVVIRSSSFLSIPRSESVDQFSTATNFFQHEVLLLRRRSSPHCLCLSVSLPEPPLPLPPTDPSQPILPRPRRYLYPWRLQPSSSRLLSGLLLLHHRLRARRHQHPRWLQPSSPRKLPDAQRQLWRQVPGHVQVVRRRRYARGSMCV